MPAGVGLTFRDDIVTGPGGSQILLEDPAGNLIEFFEPRRNDERHPELNFATTPGSRAQSIPLPRPQLGATGSHRGSGLHMGEYQERRAASPGLRGLLEGRLETISELLADDVVWHNPGRGPLAGDHRGRDRVLALFAKQMELTGGTFRVELHDVLANDEHGLIQSKATAEREGKTWADNGVLVFHIKDRKASEVWLHPGDLYAADEFFA